MRGDCFYFMTSNCSKGNDCAYRHSIAAKYSDTVCSVWKRGGECTVSCPYKHSEYCLPKEKPKTTVECYWEKNGGCKKNNCPFVHTQKSYEHPCLLDIQNLNYELEQMNIPDYDSQKPIIAKSIHDLMVELKELDSVYYL